MSRAHGGETPGFGKTLKKYREALGKQRSLDVVVRRLQTLGFRTAKSTLSHYENGRPPDMGVLFGLSKIYGVSFSVLCQMVADELSDHVAQVPPPPQPTAEALSIARAFDAGTDLLRVVLSGSVDLWLAAHRRGNDRPSPEPKADDVTTASGSHGRGRKSRPQR